MKKTVKRSTRQRNITRVSGVPPYEWVAAAIERFAEGASIGRAAACCLLLDRGLRRDLETLRVLRPAAASRGVGVDVGGNEGSMIQSFSYSAEYETLPERLEEALGILRDCHVERAKTAMRKLAKVGLADADDFYNVRGWRTTTDVGGESLSGVAIQFVGEKRLPKQALIDACDCVTTDMVGADVIRALFARELERVELAPEGWADRSRSVGVGWLNFHNRVIR